MNNGRSYMVLVDDRGTIRPPKVLVDYINNFLKSEESKELGFTTPTSFVEHLVRTFVEKNIHSPKIKHLSPDTFTCEAKKDEIVFRQDGEQIELIVKHTTNDENILVCTRCHDPNCIYRNYVLEKEEFWSFLKDHGVFLKRPRYTKNHNHD